MHPRGFQANFPKIRILNVNFHLQHNDTTVTILQFMTVVHFRYLCYRVHPLPSNSHTAASYCAPTSSTQSTPITRQQFSRLKNAQYSIHYHENLLTCFFANLLTYLIIKLRNTGNRYFRVYKHQHISDSYPPPPLEHPIPSVQDSWVHLGPVREELPFPTVAFPFAG